MGDQLVAEYANGTTYFAHSDHLGSTRLLTGVSGTVQDCYAFYPFGETDTSICTPTYNALDRFTGFRFDPETNLDHTWFRKYSSAQGRWMTPDPAGLAAVDPSNPQSWNRYAYVLNEPMSFVDPLGLFILNNKNNDDDDVIEIDDAKSASNHGGCTVTMGLVTINFFSCPFISRGRFHAKDLENATGANQASNQTTCVKPSLWQQAGIAGHAWLANPVFFGKPHARAGTGTPQTADFKHSP